MAITVPRQWKLSEGDADCEVITNPTAGNWLVAVVAVRVVNLATTEEIPEITVGDFARGPWELIHTDTQWAASTHAGAFMRMEVWVCPSVRYEGWPWLAVYSAARQILAFDAGSHEIVVAEVAGMTGRPTVDSVTPVTATAATSLSIPIPAPSGGAECFMLAGAAIDVNSATLTATGSGFTALQQLGVGAPDLKLGPQWKITTTAQTATWTSSAAADWVGVAVALRTTGTAVAQPNPNWPATSLQIGLGYDLSTPLGKVAWTDQTARFLGMDADRGVQAELGTTEQGSGVVVIDNRDGAYTTRPVATASATAAGTTTTIKVPSTTAPLNVGDFFRIELANTDGDLKELNVFQVTGLSTAGGTTTVTFKRADGTPGGAKVATATGDVYAGVKVDLYTPWRLVMTWQGTAYVVASGWLRDLAVSYRDAAWAQTESTSGDAVESLTAINPSALRGEILRRFPMAYWPLDDASGSGYAANASGTTSDVLMERTSKWGAGQAQADFGQSTQDVASIELQPNFKTSVRGDDGTGWGQTGGVAADLATKGYALVGSSRWFPSLANGVTITGLALVVDPNADAILNATADPAVVTIRNANAGGGARGGVFRLQVSRTTLKASITKWDKTTHAQTTTADLGVLQIAGADWRSWALVLTQTTWAVYVDGLLQGSGSCNLPATWTGINIGGEADSFGAGRTWGATHAHIAVFARALTSSEINNLHNAGTEGFVSGEEVGSRIQKKLSTTGWSGTRIIGNAYSPFVGPEGSAGGTVTDLANEAVGYEDALFFADAAGQLQYRSRSMADQQRTRVVFGDNTAGGEIPYRPGWKPSFNPSFVYNKITVSQFGPYGLSSNNVIEDVLSSSKYGTRGPLSRETRLGNGERAWHLANWLLGRYAWPQQRVETITISAHAYPAAWPTVLGIEVGDLVTVMRRQIGAPALAVPCRVLKVAPSIEYGASVDASVTLTLGSAPPQVPICSDSVYGTVGGKVLAL
ncbi:LamG-like jellyroll fold domain-containing protein [Actinomadura montaniterrae]|uniref:LamG domain-containing protein n=1 Tax=Actinomadura montaniterrae TaxID=1803903 RepID=A0A6L3VXA5_9ACTN|nr:LamG-like jellyroll fold domain-containing protein [Actinomadura montaniterrae]KAB2384761.1 LamG domain-containing protein [Actinomadura montaniterrae]